MVVLGGFFWFLQILDGSCGFLMVLVVLGGSFVVLYGSWRFLEVLDGSWWF